MLPTQGQSTVLEVPLPSYLEQQVIRQNFINKMEIVVPLKIVKKSDSGWMRFLGKVMFFNKKFLFGYTTTIGKTIYLNDDLFGDGVRASQVIAHEAQHIWDNRRLGLLYPLMYLFPQILALLSFGAIWNPWFLLCLLFLLPLPAPGRMWIERRGYLLTLQLEGIVTQRDLTDRSYDIVVQQFTSADYYYMWPISPSKLKTWLRFNISQDLSPVYTQAKSFFLNSKNKQVLLPKQFDT